MNAPSIRRVRDLAAAAVMRALSYRKRDWSFSDYPVFVRQQVSEPAHQRSSLPPFVAYIVNWNLSGTGETREQAKSSLAANFETAKQGRLSEGKQVPRPGTEVPVEFASDEHIERNRALSNDFIDRVLEFQWAFISDESSLWDFHSNTTNEALHRKIREVYGVDVSDIESARLWEILDRIAATPSRTSN